MTLNTLEDKTLQWSEDRGITINGNSITQAMKLVSEVGELCDSLIKGKDIKDDIGDILVLCTNIAKLENTNLTECWTIAWNDIKDRKGFLNSKGNFIKDTDPAYAQAIKERIVITRVRVEYRPEPDFAHVAIVTCKLSNNKVTNSSVVLTVPLSMEVLESYIGKTMQELNAYLATIGGLK